MAIKELNNKQCMINGAASGIGRSVALAAMMTRVLKNAHSPIYRLDGYHKKQEGSHYE